MHTQAFFAIATRIQRAIVLSRVIAYPARCDTTPSMTSLHPARFPDDLDAVRAIFREYADSLGVDLSFQAFDAELASLPGKYAPPAGAILLAWRDGRVIGCVALRPFEYDICEMKRLYVREEGRGQQLGRRLAQAVVHAAREAGYRKMRLDTLPTMQAAQQLYASLGFRPISAYVFNPIEGTRFLELDL
jgi:ribosomal protein S18 acetylase RimI-like enzyme